MTTALWTNTKMRVEIDGSQAHCDACGRANLHYMTVDGHGLLLDLSKIEGTLVDPTITRVTWGRKLGDNFGGSIWRQGESKPQPFSDSELLAPYLNAWRLRRDELLGT